MGKALRVRRRIEKVQFHKRGYMKTVLRQLAVFLLSFLGSLLLAKDSAAQLGSAAGVDQVLSSFASVVKDRANEVALNIIREQFVNSLSGKAVTLESEKPIVVYLGKYPGSDSTHPPEVFFKKSFDFLEKANLSITDPLLLKAINRDMVEFAFRISLNSVESQDFENVGMPDIADFSSQMIEIMASSDPDVHRLGQPLIDLSKAISSRFATTFSAEATRRSDSSVPVTLSNVQVGQLVRQTLDRTESDTLKRNEKIKDEFGVDPSRTFVSYKSANADANRELAAFFNLLGNYLLAHQADSSATDIWTKAFSKKISDLMKTPVSGDFKTREILLKISVLLHTQKWQGDSGFVSASLVRA